MPTKSDNGLINSIFSFFFIKIVVNNYFNLNFSLYDDIFIFYKICSTMVK
jgi:hypothetical protein